MPDDGVTLPLTISRHAGGEDSPEQQVEHDHWPAVVTQPELCLAHHHQQSNISTASRQHTIFCLPLSSIFTTRTGRYKRLEIYRDGEFYDLMVSMSVEGEPLLHRQATNCN